MRSAFFSLCLLLACTVAYGEDPWSSLFNYAGPASVEGKTFPGGGRYLMPKILSGRPIKIYVTGYQVKPEKFPHIQEQIAESYNDWFSETAEIIRDSGREAEFADVLKILDRGVKIEFLDKSQRPERDIEIVVERLKFVQTVCGDNAGGCFRMPLNPAGLPELYLPTDSF